jgi:hypothetical protein
MLHWNALLHLGDLDVTIPAAAALTAWLAIARAWRIALWWSGLFALGLGLVGLNKIAFIGWGTGLPGLDFKAASGHAAGVTALLPMMLYLLLEGRTRTTRAAGVAAGLGLGLAMAMLLVRLEQHTAAEALAGWTLGALISLAGIKIAGAPTSARATHGLACSGMVFLLAAWMMQSAPVGYWMIRMALLLSGNRSPCAWDT